jgi:hypothetical protein
MNNNSNNAGNSNGEENNMNDNSGNNNAGNANNNANNNANGNANNNGNDNGNDNGNAGMNNGNTTACWSSLSVPALVLLFGLLLTYYMMGSNVHVALKLAGLVIAGLAALSAFGQVMLCARKQTALGWGLGGATLAVVVGGIILLFAWLQNRTSK